MKPGRKSQAEETALTHLPKPPELPNSLTPEEQTVWRETVSAMTPDWFTKESHRLLIQYCRHVVIADRFTEKVRDAKDDSELNRYTRILRNETATISSLATKMRLTQQSRYDAAAASRKKTNWPAGPKPWDDRRKPDGTVRHLE